MKRSSMARWRAGMVAVAAVVLGGGATVAATAPPSTAPGEMEAPTPSTEPLPVESPHIRISAASEGVSAAHRFVAIDEGFYEAEGIDVEIVPYDGGPAALQGLFTGQIDVYAGGFPVLLGLYGSDDQPVIFHELNSTPSFTYFGSEGNGSWAELADSGGVIGVSSIGGQDHQIAMWMAEESGVEPTKLNFQAAGGAAARLTGVRSGQLAAASATLVTAQPAIDDGFAVIDTLSNHLDRFPTSIYATTNDWYEANPGSIAALVRAERNAVEWIRSHRDEALDVFAEHVDVAEEDRPATQAAIGAYLDGWETPGFSVEGYELLTQFAIDRGDLDASDAATVVQSFIPDLQE